MNTCSKCKNIVDDKQKFCSFCGGNLEENKETKPLTNTLIFSGFVITYLITYSLFSTEITNLQQELSFEIVFALAMLIFSLTDVRNIFGLFRIRKMPFKIALFALIFPFISSPIVNFSMEGINWALFGETYSNYFAKYVGFNHPVFWSFIFIAVFPAIFEEIGFRGYLFNQLLKISSARTTIIVSAFIFALIHFSFISFLWIFPFGLVLGYLRFKYKTLWIGFYIHFIHNSIILLFDYFEYYNLLIM